jgi:hypothetical protein
VGLLVYPSLGQYMWDVETLGSVAVQGSNEVAVMSGEGMCRKVAFTHAATGSCPQVPQMPALDFQPYPDSTWKQVLYSVQPSPTCRFLHLVLMNQPLDAPAHILGYL